MTYLALANLGSRLAYIFELPFPPGMHLRVLIRAVSPAPGLRSFVAVTYYPAIRNLDCL